MANKTAARNAATKTRPTKAKPPAVTEQWYARLDPAWKAAFADQCGVDSPAKVTKLAAVKELYLDDACAVTSLAPLEQLAKLAELNCDAKQVTDLRPLAKLPKLASLRITSPIDDFAPLAKLTGLTSLELSDTAIADLTPLAKLAKLARLELNDTPVADLAPIAGLTKIERLEIARTKVRSLAPIAKWKKLNDLVVTGCPIESFDVLARIPDLHSLNVSHTGIRSLAPIDHQAGIHILQLIGTAVSFAELIRYRQVRGVQQDSMLGLDIYSDFMTPEAFIAALAELGTTAGVEPMLTAWINDVLLALIRNHKAELACQLLERWFALAVAPNQYTKELAANALHLVVTQPIDAALERRVLDQLVPQAVIDRRLAFNLACYHAKRGNKPEVLRYGRIALEHGHEAASFRSDGDFATLRGDREFEALIATNFTPDPYTSPAAWWSGLPDDLRQCLWVDGDDEAAIAAMLDRLDDLQLDGVRSLDPLRGLRIKRLVNRQCRASSLEVIATLRGLEQLVWEKDEYLGGTQLTDLSPLANLTTLRVLEIAGHKFTNLEPLAALVNLEKLKLGRNPIQSIEALRNLTKLTDLAIDPPAPIDLSPLARLSALESLWLQGPVLAFEPIAELRSLRRLWIQRCTLADGSPVPLDPLRGLSKLEHVWVASSRQAEVKKELKKVLPKCKVG